MGRKDGRLESTITIDGKRIHVYGKSKAEIQAKKEMLLDDYARGLLGVQSMTFKEYGEQWYNLLEGKKPNTMDLYRRAFEHAAKYIGKRHVESLRRSDIETMLQNYRDTPEMRNKILSICDMIFDMAIDDRIITINPCLNIKRIKGERHVKRPLTKKETEAYLKCDTEPNMRLMADILYYTGMRLGEMLACKRPKGDVLVVSEQVQWDHSGNPFLTTPKTQGSKREIPIPSQLREEIKNYMKGKNEMYLFQPFPARHKFHKSWQAFIVSMARYMDPDYTQEKSLRDLRSEHLPLPITPHYLRHNYASLLYNADVDILTAKKYLGHSSISTTLGIYSHLSENKEVREKEKVLDLFAVNE